MKLYTALGQLILFAVVFKIGSCDDKNYFNSRKQRQSPQDPLCTPGYYYSNGWCYPTIQHPICPEGYQLQNNMCYPKELKPCPSDSSTTPIPTTTSTLPTTTSTLPTTTSTLPTTSSTLPTTTSTTPTTTSTLPTTTSTLPTTTSTLPTTTSTAPATTSTTPIVPTAMPTTPVYPPGCESTTVFPPSEEVRCPYGSVFFKRKCRKIICPHGEYVDGRCIQVVCPEGTVWRGHSCQKPGFVTTILEIQNVFINEAHEHPGQVDRINTNNMSYHTEHPETITVVPTIIPHVTTLKPPSEIIAAGCCTIFTPRTCKKYGKKWICFNNRLKRCDPDICKYPTMYVKTPKVIYEPPILIMPPNPPLQACPTTNCDARDIVDCSGCPEGRRERCSPYCYKYICPQGTCGYIDHQDFCRSYPGSVGCTKEDGCIWGWCGENRSKLTPLGINL